MRDEEGNRDNPIDKALKNYTRVSTYRVTLRSKSGNSTEEIRYYYKAGHVRMEFICPFRGAVLIYDPIKHEALLKPFGITNLVMPLNPDSEMIRSTAGHRIHESDIGSLLRAAAELRSNGTAQVSGEESIAGRRVLLVKVIGNEHVAVSGVHAYDLYLDKETYFPLKAHAYGISGECREEVLMDDLETNIDLPDDLFSLA